MATAAPSPPPKTLLIVDDDASLREILGEVFREEGFVVTTAANGAVAIQLLTWVTPAVIVLDIHMPVMDGFAFATAYQRRPGPHAPIVVFSTAAESARVRAMEPASVVPKPCDLDTLIATVERQIPA